MKKKTEDPNKEEPTIFADEDADEYELETYFMRASGVPIRRIRLWSILTSLRVFTKHCLAEKCYDGCAAAVLLTELPYLLSSLCWIVVGGLVGRAFLGGEIDLLIDAGLVIVIGFLLRTMAGWHGRYHSVDALLHRLNRKASILNEAASAHMPTPPGFAGAFGISVPQGIDLPKILKEVQEEVNKRVADAPLPGESEVDHLIRMANTEFAKKQEEKKKKGDDKNIA